MFSCGSCMVFQPIRLQLSYCCRALQYCDIKEDARERGGKYMRLQIYVDSSPRLEFERFQSCFKELLFLVLEESSG
jgi:hypothetical protein